MNTVIKRLKRAEAYKELSFTERIEGIESNLEKEKKRIDDIDKNLIKKEMLIREALKKKGINFDEEYKKQKKLS